jgi:hypothetical protein
MREVIPARLWIGNAVEARDVRSVLGCGIVAIVDLAIEEPPTQFPRDTVYCRFPLVDGAGNSSIVLHAAVRTVSHFLASGLPTLVACGAGMSRSPAIVAAAIAENEQRPLREVLAELTAGQPHDVSPGLLHDIATH